MEKGCRQRRASESGRLNQSFEREVDPWSSASACKDVRADDGSKVIAITGVRRHVTPYECTYFDHQTPIRPGLDLPGYRTGTLPS